MTASQFPQCYISYISYVPPFSALLWGTQRPPDLKDPSLRDITS